MTWLIFWLLVAMCILESVINWIGAGIVGIYNLLTRPTSGAKDPL